MPQNMPRISPPRVLRNPTMPAETSAAARLSPCRPSRGFPSKVNRTVSFIDRPALERRLEPRVDHELRNRAVVWQPKEEGRRLGNGRRRDPAGAGRYAGKSGNKVSVDGARAKSRHPHTVLPSRKLRRVRKREHRMLGGGVSDRDRGVAIALGVR